MVVGVGPVIAAGASRRRQQAYPLVIGVVCEGAESYAKPRKASAPGRWSAAVRASRAPLRPPIAAWSATRGMSKGILKSVVAHLAGGEGELVMFDAPPALHVAANPHIVRRVLHISNGGAAD